MAAIINQILVIILATQIMNGQSIDIYYPFGDLSPNEVDGFGGEYANEIMIITGIVSGENQAGHAGSKGYTTHIIGLQKWKLNGVLQSEKLVVFRPIESNRDFFHEIPKYSIVKLKVFLNEEKNRSVLISGEFILNPESDFIEMKEELQKPVFLKIDNFNHFQLNKDINVFEGNIEWNNEQIRFVIQVEKEAEITDEIKTIKTLLASQTEWKKRVDDYAVKELLPLKNESWLEENEKPWSKERFLKTYKLESIWISKDGQFQFWHEDGDIFWGHSILIEGTIKQGPNYADIPG